MSDVKKSFRSLVMSCLKEVKEEKKKSDLLKESLRRYVRKVMNEVISGPDAPEQDDEEEEKINKGYSKDGNQPTDVTQDQQIQQLTKIVHGINSDFNVYRSTAGTGSYKSGKRNFIIIDAGDVFTVRIKERWENNFDVEAMIRENDRVVAIGLNWEQVKAFVKENFGEVAKTYVQKGMEKVNQDREDKAAKKDADLPDTSVKTRKIGNQPAKLGDEEAEDMVKNKEDLPSAPMKTVAKKPKFEPETKNKAKDQKETPQVKPEKQETDKELVKRMPGKKKDPK